MDVTFLETGDPTHLAEALLQQVRTLLNTCVDV